MKIFSARQIKDIDTYTIKYKPIDSIDLMEHASKCFFQWFCDQINYNQRTPIHVICGQGNNGGDGLAIARMLLANGYKARVSVIQTGNSPSLDFRSNLYNYQQLENAHIDNINTGNDLTLSEGDIIVDAILGIGVNRPLEGILLGVVDKINNLGAKVYAVDMPSGLQADDHTDGVAIHALHTLSFQSPKLAFMFPENGQTVKSWEVADIGLLPEKIESTTCHNYYLDKPLIKKLVVQREKFAHKGSFGHAEIIAGSFGKVGATVLAARACLRSGTGLLSVQLPGCGYDIVQTQLPEAMVSHVSGHKHISSFINSDASECIGIGPGLGQHQETIDGLRDFLKQNKTPLVLDADALNIIATEKLLDQIPKNSILTPHVREFERLFGRTSNDFDRHRLQKFNSNKYGIYIVLKGAHTCVTCPNNEAYFNSTGNHGMATAGSGDVLTGVITGLMAQGYDAKSSALLGVYVHGLAGDMAAIKNGYEGLIASDILDYLPQGFKSISNG